MPHPFRSTNRHFRATVEVNASPATTWAYLTDVARWPEWDTELKSAVLDGPFTNGSTGRMTPRTGPDLRFTLSDVEPGRRYLVTTPLPVGALVMDRRLEGAPGTLTFIDHIRFTGPLRWVFGLLLGRGFRAVLPQVLQTFKQQAEQL